MPPKPGIPSLNHGPAAASRHHPAISAAGIRWDATPIRISAPPVRIVGSGSRYRGGYRVDV